MGNMSLLNFLSLEDQVITSQETKTCRLCNQTKPINQFHKSGEKPGWKGKRYPRYVDGYRTECAKCRSKNGPAHSGAAGELMKREGLKRPPIGTPCELCCKTDQKLFCDHDHQTGKFRGWLCSGCNSALARIGDNIDGVMKLVNYLQK